jgi:predicted dithiol-disulfide oxidoreductase (DUF899 family)
MARPKLSVFARERDDVFHTYSTFARGLDPYNATYQLLDIAPFGRNGDELPYPMDWVRRNDEYQGDFPQLRPIVER